MPSSKKLKQINTSNKLKPINTLGTPSCRAKLKRQQKESAVISKIDLTDSAHDTSDTPAESAPAIVIESQRLTHSDLERVKSPTGWLNDRLINAGQILLKKSFIMYMIYKMYLLEEPLHL